jgi:hypothetical protein
VVCHIIIFSTETPNDVVVELWTIHWQLAVCIEAAATSGSLFTTAIAVRNQVSLTIAWVVAAGNP